MSVAVVAATVQSSPRPRTLPGPGSARQARLSLLDRFELWLDGRAVAVALPVQRLLAFLALHRRPVVRSSVSGTLWIDADERRASGNLRSALWRLRGSGIDVISASATHLSLAEGVVVDLEKATRLGHALMEGTDDASLDGEVDLLSKELLPDWYDDWLLMERERFRQLRLHALEALCERLTVRGSYMAAIEAGLAAVAIEPLRESAHQVLIRAHLAEGNRAEALRQFDVLRRLLSAELGVDPSRRLAELIHS